MKSLMLYANQDSGLDARLSAAIDLARVFGAHLHCLQVVPYDAFVMGDPFGGVYALPTVIEQVRQTADTQREAAEERLRGEGVAWDWQTFDGAPAQLIVDRARLADLIIMSQPAGADQPGNAGPILADVLVHARSPVLAIASEGPRFDAFGPAAVAWDGSLESCHALRLALPMLKRASTVHVVTVSEGGTEFPATDACRYLALHDIGAELHEVPRESRSVAEALVDTAQRLSAAYLVAGAYGHTRLREAILGGTTRDLLQGSSIPLLMAH